MADVVKVTKKDYFEALKVAVEGMDTVGEYAVEDVINFIDTQIAQLDAKAAKAKENAAKKAAEGDELRVAVLAAVTDTFQTADEITAAIEGEDVTKSKVVARLTQLVKAGDAVKEEQKTDNGKKMAYKLA